MSASNFSRKSSPARFQLVTATFALYLLRMPKTERGKRARKAANVYAPVPVDSPLMYGLVAIVLSSLAMWVVVKFYGFDLTTHPVLIALGFVIIFIGAVLLRRRRMRHHNLAFDEEYKRDKAASD